MACHAPSCLADGALCQDLEAYPPRNHVQEEPEDCATQAVQGEWLVAACPLLAGRGLDHVPGPGLHHLWHLHSSPAPRVEIHCLQCILLLGALLSSEGGRCSRRGLQLAWLRAARGGGQTCPPTLLPLSVLETPQLSSRQPLARGLGCKCPAVLGQGEGAQLAAGVAGSRVDRDPRRGGAADGPCTFPTMAKRSVCVVQEEWWVLIGT